MNDNYSIKKFEARFLFEDIFCGEVIGFAVGETGCVDTRSIAPLQIK